MRVLVAFCLLLAGCTGQAPEAPTAAEPVEDVGYRADPLGAASGDLAAYEGQVVLLTVWASWCSICKGDEPVWDSIHQDYAAEGFTVFAVSRESSRAAAQEYVDGAGFAYPSFWDPGVNAAFGLRNYQPNHVLIDADGNVVMAFEGSLRAREGGEAALRADIEALLG